MRQSGLLYVFVSLHRVFVCFCESECENWLKLIKNWFRNWLKIASMSQNCSETYDPYIYPQTKYFLILTDPQNGQIKLIYVLDPPLVYILDVRYKKKCKKKNNIYLHCSSKTRVHILNPNFSLSMTDWSHPPEPLPHVSF